MAYYVGIDGGGSKTRFACFDENGRLLGQHVSGGSYYRQLGAQAVISTIMDGLNAVCEGLDEAPAAISFGMPGYGEAVSEDENFVSMLRESIGSVPLFVANDVAMAFYGAFSGGRGIMLVAGTGSMAWGMDDTGKERRCGGWSELFGDEGSGYWVGKKAIELFSRESDGRMPRTAFYSLFRAYMGAKAQDDDLSLAPKLEALFASRASVAAVHKVLYDAAKAGDKAAIDIYARAVDELYAIILAMRQAMSFDGTVPVSYVGGMFNCKELILEPLKTKLRETMDVSLCPPVMGPCEGAVLFAAEKLMNKEKFCVLRDGMLREEIANV